MLLAIDTSGSRTSIAIFDCRAPLSSQHENKDPLNNSNIDLRTDSHSSSLALLVKNELIKSGLDIQDLEGLVVGAGPGSFTGLRIGFSFAKGIAVATKIPLFASSSLAAAAWQFKGNSEVVLALDDARRGEFFASAFSFKGGVFRQEIPDQIFTLEEVRQWQSSHPESSMVTANPDLLATFEKIQFAEDISRSLGEQILSNGWRPQNSYQSTASKSFAAQALADLSPLYVRKVAAMTIEERISRSNG